MRLKDFNIIISFCLISFITSAQYTVSGLVTDSSTGNPIDQVAIYNKNGGLLATTNAQGSYLFTTQEKELELVFYSFEYEVLERELVLTKNIKLNVELSTLSTSLNAIEISARREKIFELERLKDVEGTAIYAGKKTEVVLVEQSMANRASNNARQIYNRVAGLNIYQNDDAGLQLNIGGRGLDPNRTSNFNTRQNGYDISADVLGYPESYYAPASEGMERIEIVRGAASLQYGTQFGGLINFVMKKPNAHQPIEFITRNTVGSYGLYTNFTSIGGAHKKLSYYSFFNYKRGDGFRPNSDFESKNVFAHLGYQLNDKTKISGEVTYLNYLAQQAGGLTDDMFNENPYQSNRSRNWFKIDWLLYNLKFEHSFTDRTEFSFNAFGLNASRNALGFRTNRVDQVDSGNERDLIKGDFNNYGFEARLLHRYQIGSKKSIFLIGTKFYKADNTSIQGPGSARSDADFSFENDEFPNYENQSSYVYPNLNLALFGENIFYINEKISITPGFRLEHINTQSDGFYRNINTDAAGNVILNERIDEDLKNERTFLLLGIGASYKPSSYTEIYANASQNYRSVTFTDISIINPAFSINPDIKDESGYTVDMGIRGDYKKHFSYDASVFGLFYNDRIGFIQKNTSQGIKSERGNIGNAFIYGLESVVDFNLKKLLTEDPDYVFNFFINTSVIQSEYTTSSANGVTGNRVEFVPEFNFKTGVKLGYKNLLTSLQYSYLSNQFTDATNSVDANLSGVIGQIPSYDVLDFSASYQYKKFKLETGINNLLDNAYFTRRATGYPGPGIIPSPPRNYYLTLEIKI